MATDKARGKILRVGIIHGDRIIEERLFRKKQTVTVGQSPKNTFVLPLPGVPRSFKLLEPKGDGYDIYFTNAFHGKIAFEDKVHDLESIKSTQIAKKRGKSYVLHIKEGNRGKIVIGNVAFLFQFVKAPQPVPKLQLPAAAKGSWYKQLDMTLILLTLVSFVLQAGSIVGLNIWWEVKGKYQAHLHKSKSSVLYQTLKAEVQLKKENLLDKPDKTDDEGDKALTEAAEQQEDENKPDEEEKKPKKTAKAAKKAAGPVDPKKMKALHHKKMVKKVKSTTLLKFLGSAGEGDGSPLYQNTLKDGVTASKLEDAWNSKGGIAVAKPGEGGEYIGGPKSVKYVPTYAKSLDNKGGKAKIKTEKVETKVAKKEMKVKLRVSGGLGNQIGAGSINKGSVAKVFKKRQGAIKSCYEKQLKINPGLSGKIQLMFTIGPAGRITMIKVQVNTTNDSALGSCITNKIKSWKFPKPDNGSSVTFAHTLILQKG